jgi:6-pyruvoyltetrahydropterin/6-carboxytetrahydropterin synthase
MAQKIRLTKQFTFEMAHVLYGHDGACSNIHGHSYKLDVTLLGTPLNQPGHPKHGMVMDFSDLKKIVQGEIIEVFDHALAIDEHSPMAKQNIQDFTKKLVLLPYQPTCENMLLDFAPKIQNFLPSNVTLITLKLAETASSYAEWHLSDNS